MTKFATNSASWFRGRLSIIFFDSVGLVIVVLSTFFVPLRLFRRFVESVTIFFSIDAVPTYRIHAVGQRTLSVHPAF
jgi:hypothetical protein